MKNRSMNKFFLYFYPYLVSFIADAQTEYTKLFS